MVPDSIPVGSNNMNQSEQGKRTLSEPLQPLSMRLNAEREGQLYCIFPANNMYKTARIESNREKRVLNL